MDDAVPLPVLHDESILIQIRSTIDAFSEVIGLDSTNLVILSLAVALLCILIIFLIFRRKSEASGTSILLVGASDAGKTALLSKLVFNQTIATHASLQVNSSVALLPDLKKPVKIIDIPGHPRIRDQFNQYLADARIIIFVVDSSTISRNSAIVAEHLHIILNAIMSLPPSQALPPLVILAHKYDLLKSSGAADSRTLAINRVKSVLERELEKRRVSQSGGLGIEGLGSGDDRSEMGGLECTGPGGVFKFDEWDGGQITFLGTSIRPTKSEEDTSDGLNDLYVCISSNF